MVLGVKLITKEELIRDFKNIESQGWIENTSRKTNDGAAGNKLEDLLGIPENNLPIPNAAEWELKTHRNTTSSLVTLFHTEPSPRAAGIVPKFLLPNYGWPHKEAGNKYPETERSFRATLDAISYTRGFTVYYNKEERKICIKFNASKVLEKDYDWLDSVKMRVGNLNDLSVVPYWNIDEIYAKTKMKLLNCFFVYFEVKKENERTYFHYFKALMLKDFSIDKFINELEKGHIKIDFDARTGHNHGTKCRIEEKYIPSLYESSSEVLNEPLLNI
nr:MAG TPA: MvaI/BcnI restriction endonuclease family [Caudoviricetes sp.]